MPCSECLESSNDRELGTLAQVRLPTCHGCFTMSPSGLAGVSSGAAGALPDACNTAPANCIESAPSTSDPTGGTWSSGSQSVPLDGRTIHA